MFLIDFKQNAGDTYGRLFHITGGDSNNFAHAINYRQRRKKFRREIYQ
jgi:hypothetical protein